MYIKIYAVKLKKEETFQIKIYRSERTCGHQQENNKIIALYLAEKYLDRIGEKTQVGI